MQRLDSWFYTVDVHGLWHSSEGDSCCTCMLSAFMPRWPECSVPGPVIVVVVVSVHGCKAAAVIIKVGWKAWVHGWVSLSHTKTHRLATTESTHLFLNENLWHVLEKTAALWFFSYQYFTYNYCNLCHVRCFSSSKLKAV